MLGMVVHIMLAMLLGVLLAVLAGRFDGGIMTGTLRDALVWLLGE